MVGEKDESKLVPFPYHHPYLHSYFEMFSQRVLEIPPHLHPGGGIHLISRMERNSIIFYYFDLDKDYKNRKVEEKVKK